jgi:hypothetical protein
LDVIIFYNYIKDFHGFKTNDSEVPYSLPSCEGLNKIILYMCILGEPSLFFDSPLPSQELKTILEPLL